MIKMKGFDALTKKMDQMSKFVAELEGEIAHLSFDPNDPVSIEAAIQEMSDAIDAKARSYERNDWVANLATEIKEKYRSQILEKAAAARLKDGAE